MPNASFQQKVEQIGVALGHIAIGALISPVSQRTLAPVYGSIAASINHHIAVPVAFLLGFLIHASLSIRQRRAYIRYTPLIAAATPVAQLVAFYFSTQLGLIAGPIVAGFISCHVILISAAFAAADALYKVEIVQLAGFSSALSNASIALLPFTLLERFFAIQLDDVLSGSKVLGPAELQLIIAGAFCLLMNTSEILLVLTGGLLLLTWFFNPHGKGLYSDRITTLALAQSEWSVLARSWSNTGYISVLESKSEAYRVLRCGHSLLGGEWLVTPDRQSQGWQVDEPIYSVFVMLEAVRLLSTVADEKAKALVIGLGVGNAPAAMIKHGIATTILELDPMVHQYATEYFNLPVNHTVILSDAVAWVREQSSKDIFDTPKYDYIVHDVFTGGAEPLPLFTTSFIQSLRTLLTPDGIVAINYAGDINEPLTALVLNTINTVFQHRCQIYGDDPPQLDDTAAAHDTSFNNFIVFCRNNAGPLTFRQPVASDFLGSMIRKEHLLPRSEQRIDFPQADGVLEGRDLRKWGRSQVESAKKHWHVMRKVLPAQVWELY